MRIAFDATAFFGKMSRGRGIANYAMSQFSAIIRQDRQNQYFFFNVFEHFSMKERLKVDNVHDCFFNIEMKDDFFMDKNLEEAFGALVQSFIAKNKIDVFYITSPFECDFFLYKKEWFKKAKIVCTVYDIIPFARPDLYLQNDAEKQKYMACLGILRFADKCFVISESVKKDLIGYLNFPAEKIKVVYGASDGSIYKKMQIGEDEKNKLLQKFGIKRKFVLSVSGADKRKNNGRLIEAFGKTRQKIRDGWQLVVISKFSEFEKMSYIKAAKKNGLGENVVFTGFVSADDLVALYNLADLTAFPSLYEGFGLPVVESWMCGTSVLTSNNSALGEIAKDAAILVDPFSVQSIAEGLEKALLETDLDGMAKKGAERLKFFNWDNVASFCLEGFSEIEKKMSADFSAAQSSAAKQSRKKIAFFTPLPPMQSGISDFSVDILLRLSKHFCIDVFTDRYAPNPLELDNVKTFVYTCFEQKANEYDEIVYQVGNSKFHTYMFDFIKKYPGIVELHDSNLSGIIHTEFFAENHICEGLFQILCEDLSVDEAKKYIAAELRHHDLQTAEINGFAVNYAKLVIVHSEYAKKSLLKKNPKLNVLKIPLYSIVESDKSRLKKTEKRKNLGIVDADIVIAAFGFIHRNKRIISILKAFAKIKSAQKNAVLHFVGKLSPDLADDFWESIKSLNLQNSVFVAGFTTLEKFNDYMDAVDICLNLRYPYNGENSASLTRLLGKGKCVILNRIGSFAEIPEDCCIMIDSPENMSEKEEVCDIASAIEQAMDGKKRLQIEDHAAKFAKENLDLDLLENQYVAAIENASETSVLNDFSVRSAEFQANVFELTEWGKKYENFCKRWRIFFKIRGFFRWLKICGLKATVAHAVECVFKRSKA